MLDQKALHRRHRKGKSLEKADNHRGKNILWALDFDMPKKRPLPPMEKYEDIPEPTFWVYFEDGAYEAFEDENGEFYVFISLFGEGFIEQRFYVRREEVYMKS